MGVLTLLTHSDVAAVVSVFIDPDNEDKLAMTPTITHKLTIDYSRIAGFGGSPFNDPLHVIEIESDTLSDRDDGLIFNMLANAFDMSIVMIGRFLPPTPEVT